MYIFIIRPFEKLEEYSAQIASGNLDIDLQYRRFNIFGSFTWAFDHMRKEIKRARECEKEAIINNKTVIATLSHDIKTPIASIRTYAEALEANMDSTLERKERYLNVIIKKCDEVTKLTNDIFLHSLSDLDKLQIRMKESEIHQLIINVIDEMQYKTNDIHIIGIIEQARISLDEVRFAQVIENIINNARKYAKGSEISVWTENDKDSNEYRLHIKDYGNGIFPEDMPFVFDKFYRGKNINNESGAGLGLYIVKYIMTQMNAKIELINLNDGLEIILIFSHSIVQCSL